MGEESLKRRRGEDTGREDRQSIQSHEPQKMNLQKQANLFLFPLWCMWEGLAQGGRRGYLCYASASKNHYCVPIQQKYLHNVVALHFQKLLITEVKQL